MKYKVTFIVKNESKLKRFKNWAERAKIKEFDASPITNENPPTRSCWFW